MLTHQNFPLDRLISEVNKITLANARCLPFTSFTFIIRPIGTASRITSYRYVLVCVAKDKYVEVADFPELSYLVSYLHKHDLPTSLNLKALL